MILGPYRRVAGAVAMAALMALAAGTAAADPGDRLDRIREKKAKIRAQRLAAEAEMGEVLARIEVLDGRRARAEGRVDQLSAQLEILDMEIGEVSVALSEAQLRLSLLIRELLEIQRQLVEREGIFAERAVAIYKLGPTAWLDPILSAGSFPEFVHRYNFHVAALGSDTRLVEEITTLRDDTDQRMQVVEDKKLDIAMAKLELERDRDSLDLVRSRRQWVLNLRAEAVAEKEALLAEIAGRRDSLAEVEAQLDREEAEIQSILNGGSSGSPIGSGQLLWPTAGSVTSGYGYRTHPIFGDERLHTGIDIGAGYGANVVASDAGIVSYAGVMSGYGNVIVVDHGGGLATTYNHLSSFYVGSGESVGRGASIGAVGCTGYCTGPHLHFEVRVNGSPVDPMPYLS